MPDPQDPASYREAILDWSEPGQLGHLEQLALFLATQCKAVGSAASTACSCEGVTTFCPRIVVRLEQLMQALEGWPRDL